MDAHARWDGGNGALAPAGVDQTSRQLECPTCTGNSQKWIRA